MKLDKLFFKSLFVFWVVVGILLFVNGLRYGHWEIALVRNIYLPVLGAILSVPITFFIENYSHHFKSNMLLLTAVLGLAIVMAVLLGVFLNPLTLSLLGAGPDHFTLSAMTNQMVIYFMLFAAWGWLSYARISSRFPIKPDSTSQVQTKKDYLIEIEDKGHLIKLPINSVIAITANGDYVNYHTKTNSYLSSGRMQELTEALKPYGFKRIHRSTLINEQYVESVIKLGKGKFKITLVHGMEYESGKTWESNVKSLIPIEH